MRLPPPVKIGPKTLQVLELSVDESEVWRGRANHRKDAIGLDRSMGEDETALTLLHEVIHVIFDIGGFASLRDDEVVVSYLASHVLMFIRDNPQLMEMLSNED